MFLPKFDFAKFKFAFKSYFKLAEIRSGIFFASVFYVSF